MSNDLITETIAHFVGLFALSTEEARARDSYSKFYGSQDNESVGESDQYSSAASTPYHGFKDFSPSVGYRPADLKIASAKVTTSVKIDPIKVPLPQTPIAPEAQFILNSQLAAAASGLNIELPTIDPPGSITTYISQEIGLSDDDVVDLGDGFAPLHIDPLDRDITDLADLAETLVPHAAEGVPGSAEEFKTFVEASRDAIKDFEPEPTSGANTLTLEDTHLDGIFVNGQAAEALPDFLDYRPEDDSETDEDDDATTAQESVSLGENAVNPDGISAAGQHLSAADASEAARSVTIVAGDNTLINTAFLTNAWIASPVMAVMGDHVSVNAIVQANVLSNIDRMNTEAPGLSAPAASDHSFNIASFSHRDPTADSVAPTAARTDYPSFWVLTELSGDLLVTSWIDQLSFVGDNDTVTLTAKGNNVSLITGDNTTINGVSLFTVAQSYDLIIVGGSVYDANFIYQTNVLLDDDTLYAAGAFDDDDSFSGADNLLWNEASIKNVGSPNAFSGLPDDFRKAGESLAAGDGPGNAKLPFDPALSELGLVRALYITGDYINLQMVRQTNILGDADQVAVAKNSALGADIGFTVTTGGNTLINLASIEDYDSLGHTYVGGGAYSDDLLVQADFIDTSPFSSGWGSGDLVSEAVAFLGDDMGSDATGYGVDHAVAMPSLSDGPIADPMQTMLA